MNRTTLFAGLLGLAVAGFATSSSRAADAAAGQPIQARLQLLAGDTLRAYWYDPRTGAATLIGDIPKTDTQTFTPPDSGTGNDWVLVLDNAAARFPPPGFARASEN